MPEKLGHAALLMMDMDNLKHINDTFGHDWGDRYINLAGQCFAQTLPQNTICARMSGDEFIVLFYGYDRRDEIRQVLNRLSEAMKERTALLPNGDTMRISISGGIAWYPENGRDLATLKKYADFAMYQVKHESKGEMGEFDIGAYNQEVYAAQLRKEFLQMLRENSADYHFQPIFSAHTGRVAAYEALMRVKMQLLNSPLTVMKLARELDKLYEVERLTAFKATSTFMMMQNRGQLHRNTKLFLNSIASSSLTDEDVAEFKAQFAELLNNLVIEITGGRGDRPRGAGAQAQSNGRSGARSRWMTGAAATATATVCSSCHRTISRWISPLSAILIPMRISSSWSRILWNTHTDAA